jgi:hypothetical protein
MPLVATHLGLGIAMCATILTSPGASAVPERSASKKALSQPALTTRTEAFQLSPRDYPRGVEDERGYADWVRTQVDVTAKRAKSTGDDAASVELLLALANFRLARQAEPAATRWLLGRDSPEDRRSIARVAGTAKAEIKQAADVLARLERGTPDRRIGGKPLSDWKEIAGQLSALADAQADADQTRVEPGLLARLEELIKIKPSSLAAATRLWRFALMRQAGQGRQAMAQIPPATAKPNDLPYDFFLRLLHCRLLADEGGYAVATTLAVQMDSQCEGWFDKSVRPEVRRAIALLLVDLNERWADRLRQEKIGAQADRRRAAAQRLRQRLLSGRDVTVYRLGLAVPILVELPAMPTASTPASKPPGVGSRAASKPAAKTQPATTTAPSSAG